MFVEPFLDNPSLVAWGIILLKKSIEKIHENTPHTITPPPPACNVDMRHDGRMYSCGFLHTLVLTSA
ncbi:UNVERIFIED_CONTAM: hypothetical protein FKN15_073525 [Acipenser sinensis]